MKTKLSMKNFEKGQVLPILVVGLLVMIMMAALMIDGGMLLSHRRTAQAAADAGALAGAESLCPGGGGQGQAAVVAADYVARNKADAEGITFPDGNTIRVETSVTSQAFFARIFAIFGLTAGAEAEANCSPVSKASVLPVGFPCYPEAYYEDDEEGESGPASDSDICFVRYGDRTQDIPWHIANKRMVIVMDTTTVQDSYCYPEGPINCEFTDGELKSVLTGDENRGWLSLDGSGGANELCKWVYPGYDGLIGRGYWLSGQTGVRSSLWTRNDCLKMIIDAEVLVPIFDQWCRSTDPQFGCPAKWQPGDNKSLVKNGMNLDYRIEGFAIFKLTCADGPGKKDCPYRQYLIDEGILYNDNNSKSISSIEGYFLPGTIPFGGGDGINLGTYVVQLTK